MSRSTDSAAPSRLRELRSSLSARLAVSFFLLAVLLVSLSYAASLTIFNSRFEEYLNQNPLRLAESVAEDVVSIVLTHPTRDDLKKRLDEIAATRGAVIILYDARGREIMRTGTEDPANAGWCPGPMASGGAHVATLPIIEKGTVTGYVGVTVTRLGSIQATAENLRSSIARAYQVSAVAALLFAILIGLFLARNLARPIHEAIAGARRLSSGDFDVSIPVRDSSEIGELAQSVNLLAERLRELERRRLDTAADIAHEFKTPLSVIKATVEGMADGVVPADERSLRRVIAEIDRLTHLVDRLKEIRLRETEPQSPELVPLDIADFVREKVPGYEAMARKAHRHLTVTLPDGPVACRANADLLSQVLDNLIGNAFQYTRDGGHIDLSVSRESGWAVIRVADDGIGIPEEKLPLVFERFYTADESRSRKTGGSGLGLSIAKQLVELMGGSIRITSTQGQGTIVTVELPLAEAN